MRKPIVAGIVVLLAALWIAVPAGAAPDKTGALHAEINIVWTDPPAAWWGSITGDVNGMVLYPPDPERPNWVSGHAENHFVVHFHEVFTLCFGEVASPDGCQQPTSYIRGHEEGVYVLNPPAREFHFQAHGWVTEASADYAYMIGWKYLENGWVNAESGVGIARSLLAPS